MDNNRIGQAGEYLAASVLQRHFPAIAFPDKPSSYDLIVETKNNGFLKCQVKTSSVVNIVNGREYWKFNSRKASGSYTLHDCDFFAFVVLETRTVVFATPEKIKSVYRVKTEDATPETEERTIEETLGVYL